MRKNASRVISMFLIIQFILSVFAPVTVYANDATMLEPLVEPNTKTYKVDVIADKPSLFGNHQESKYIGFNKYYTSICQGGKTGEDFVEEVSKNPNYCMSMDDSLKLDGKSYNGYDFFVTAEGFKGNSGLINNDNLISSDEVVKNSFDKGTTNDFLRNDEENLMVLTFPGQHSGGAKDVTTAETEYAIEVGNTLSESLNSMLTFINGGKRFNSVSELVNKSVLIRPTDNGYTIIDTNDKDYIIVYATTGSNWGNKVVSKSNENVKSLNSGNFNKTSLVNAGYANVDENGNLLAYVIPVDPSAGNLSYGGVSTSKLLINEMASFVWAMPKGYIAIDGIDNSLKFTDGNHEAYSFAAKEGHDVPWITIHHISMYANNAYKNHNISIDTKTSATDTGNWFTAIIVEFFQTILQGLRTVLGLSDTYTLIYNKGLRSSSSYNYGAMSDTWWMVVLRYHLIFQSLAWFLIICGFIKVLIDLNLSTVNPGKRMHVFETIQRFIVVGFLLVTIIPIIQFMLNMNSVIVNIFASQVDPNATTPPVIASLAGLILQFAYFGICVYINFTYIMRSIVIGILTVTAPFFIATMAFSARNKQMFTYWIQEMAGHIFMQSIHAFSLAFLTNLITNGSGLESLVISYSIIPITELIHNMLFQGKGNAASRLGKDAGAKFNNMVQTAGNTALNAGAGFALGKLDAAGEAGKAGAGQGAGAGGKTGDYGTKQDNMAQLGRREAAQMNGIRDGIGVEKASGAGKSIGDNFKAGAAMALKAGIHGANALQGTMNMAMDMAGAELTGNVGGYKDVGRGAIETQMNFGRTVGSAAQGAGEVAGGAAKSVNAAFGGKPGAYIGDKVEGAKTSFNNSKNDIKERIGKKDFVQKAAGTMHSISEGYNAPRNVYGEKMSTPMIKDENGVEKFDEKTAASNPRMYVQQRASENIGVALDTSRGQHVTQFAGNAAGTQFSNGARGELVETFKTDALASLSGRNNVYAAAAVLANNNAGADEHAAARTYLKENGVQADIDGGRVSLTYGAGYMQANNFAAMTASGDGRSVYVRAAGVPRNFAPTVSDFQSRMSEIKAAANNQNNNQSQNNNQQPQSNG